MRHHLFAAMIAAPLFFPVVALASGGSYLVDDASVVGAGRCQLESWLHAASRGPDSVWTVPACGVGPVELGLSLDHARGQSGTGMSPAAKWQLRNGDAKGVGVALAANATYERGRYRGSQAYASTSFGVDDARRLMVDLNLGVDRQRGGDTHPLQGAGLALAISERWTVLAERLWSHALVTDQCGTRLALGASSLDLVVGRARGTNRSRWLNLGWNASF